ncbi:MAG TPA: hypothetical protein VGP99_03205 [Tepidisphaeraceae bacterium]|nr:hypothetical protein [Tepidisphaeraceae bacterium]
MRKMSLGFRVVAAAIVFAGCAAARGASVTFTLALDDDGTGAYQQGLFAVYADVSKGDNGGLHGFGIDFNDSTVSEIWNMGPAAVYTKPGSPTKWAGFTGATTEDVVRGKVSGIHELFHGDRLVPIYGLGQEDGDLSALVGTAAVPTGYVYNDYNQNLAGPAYKAHLLLAWGAYYGNPPSWQVSSVDNVAAVWDDRSGIQNFRVNPELRTVETLPGAIPEPAGILLALLSGVSLAISRHRP